MHVAFTRWDDHSVRHPPCKQATKAGPGSQGPKALIDFRAAANRLADEIERLAVASDAIDETDISLDVQIQETGREVIALLDTMIPSQARAIPSVPCNVNATFWPWTTQSTRRRLDEHETDVSIDIFDRLMPGIALSQRVSIRR